MKFSRKSIKWLVCSVVLGAALLVGASAPAFAQGRYGQDRHRDGNRGGGILGAIFGGNRHRDRRYDRHDRQRDRHYRNDRRYDNRDRNNGYGSYGYRNRGGHGHRRDRH